MYSTKKKSICEKKMLVLWFDAEISLNGLFGGVRRKRSQVIESKGWLREAKPKLSEQ